VKLTSGLCDRIVCSIVEPVLDPPMMKTGRVDFECMCSLAVVFGGCYFDITGSLVNHNRLILLVQLLFA